MLWKLTTIPHHGNQEFSQYFDTQESCLRYAHISRLLSHPMDREVIEPTTDVVNWQDILSMSDARSLLETIQEMVNVSPEEIKAIFDPICA